jgi:hypothetical protein
VIAAISGVLLFLFMFLDWYGAKAKVSFNVPGGGNFPGVNAQSPESTGNAWNAISGFWLFLLVVAIIVVVGIAVIRMLGAVDLSKLPWPPGMLLLVAGAVAFIVVLIKVIFTPDLQIPGNVHVAGVHVDIDVTRKIGLFLALLASAGMAAGGYLALGERARGGGPGPAAPAGGASAPPPPPPPPPPSGGTPAA